MSTLSGNVKLFFLHPRKLFLGLKENPDLARTAALLLIQVIALQIPNLKLVSSRDYSGTAIAAMLISTIGMIGIAFLGVLWGSAYAFIFCRCFGANPKFKAILSVMIYCGIPTIIFSLLYTLWPIKTDMVSIFSIKQLPPFFKIVLENIEPFRIWMAIMETIAIAVVSGITYFRSFLIIFSSWLVGITTTYFFGLKLGAY